jgi:FkbM family methyltransferase
MRGWLFWLFKRIRRLLSGKGIGRKFPFVRKVHEYVYCHLRPEGIALCNINGLKIYAEGKSVMARFLGLDVSYEEETTKLFTEIVRDGMNVLDLGANVGYYTLLAGSQVGERGRVFAFEPWQGSFSLLQKNIEVNGFKNITAVPKAVSSRCGRRELFLAKDPVHHSLALENGSKSVEVDVITVDEFVRERNISVDVVKMDVEGAESDVLEGMADTISKNPHMKLITELAPVHLERNNCSPSQFLRKLMDYDFRLYFIDDEKHTRALITRENIDDMINFTRSQVFANVYCDRDV